jgi:hypothetical protein
MRHFNATVFDEFISTPNTTVYTSADFNARLAQCDQIAIHAVCDNYVAVSPTITVTLEHSADGRNWVAKTLSTPLSGVVVAAGNFGAEQGMSPTLGFARLGVSCSAVMHVKIHVTARDSR